MISHLSLTINGPGKCAFVVKSTQEETNLRRRRRLKCRTCREETHPWTGSEPCAGGLDINLIVKLLWSWCSPLQWSHSLTILLASWAHSSLVSSVSLAATALYSWQLSFSLPSSSACSNPFSVRRDSINESITSRVHCDRWGTGGVALTGGTSDQSVSHFAPVSIQTFIFSLLLLGSKIVQLCEDLMHFVWRGKGSKFPHWMFGTNHRQTNKY